MYLILKNFKILIMTKSIIITYNEAEESFLMTLFNRLKIKTYNAPSSFVPDDEHPPTKDEFLNSLKESVAEMKAHQRGEIELQSIEDLLAELAEDSVNV